MTDTRSLQQIKRETEQTRAGLTDTVEQLRVSVADTAADIRQRVSPEAIKAEVSGYIKSRGEALMDDITAAARRNPMQALAIGASIAYPRCGWPAASPARADDRRGRCFRRLQDRTGGLAKAMDMASDLSTSATADPTSDQVGEQAAAAKAYASENLDRLRERFRSRPTRSAGAADQVNGRLPAQAGAALASSADSLKDRQAARLAARCGSGRDLKDRTFGRQARLASSLQDLASGRHCVGAARPAGSAADARLNAAKTARDTASDLTGRARKALLETIEQNPLVVAGVGCWSAALSPARFPAPTSRMA